MVRILLVSYGDCGEEVLRMACGIIRAEFNCEVSIIKSELDISQFYDNKRRQYDGNMILTHLNHEYSFGEHEKVIGLFDVDIFIPILTFIFGQANFKGTKGIASCYRLRNELYGLAKDNDLLFERFVKVIIHELGHSFGLRHCLAPGCVMRSSTYVENIDQKNRSFCRSCRNDLEGLKIAD